ncbi:MAG: hypothetical protein R3F62_22155, partial [Planctomycetota bacterium]
MAPSPRFAPRHVFVAVGLTLTALGLWRDRDLLALPFLGTHVYSLSSPVPTSSTPPRATEALYEAVRAHSPLTFVAALPPADRLSPGYPLKPEQEPDRAALWRAYEAARAEAFPAYAPQLEALLAAAEATHAADPQNGAHQTTAGFAELGLALEPAACEYALVHRLKAEDVDGLEHLRVLDPARLESALDRLEQGLTAPRFDFGAAEVQREVEREPLGELPLHAFFERLGRKFATPCPDFLQVRTTAELLCLLARHRAHFGGGDPERPLRLARLLGLRIGAEGSSQLELMIGTAVSQVADEAWLLRAVETQDGERAQGVRDETLRLERAYAAGFQLEYSARRLSWLDSLLIPWGGYALESGYDPALGRRSDYAVVASLVTWGLTLLALVLLPVAWWEARRAPLEPSATAPAWTLGDVLRVVLPSFGAAALGALLLLHLHPSTSFGLEAGVLALQLTTLLAWGGLGFLWQTRAATLAKLGADWTRPRRARLVPWVFLGGAYLATAWVSAGAQDTPLTVVAWGLLGVSALAGLHVYRLPGASPAFKRAVSRAEGRVSLVSLGLALCGLAALQLAVNGPLRDRAVRAYADMQLRIVEPEAWGSGALQEAMRKSLQQAPDA